MLKLKLQYFGHLMWELTHLKRPWCWGKSKAVGERDHRGRDGWMASLTQWTWVWASSRSWWWIGKPGVLQSMGSQGVRHDWVAELTWCTLQVKTWFKHGLNIMIDMRHFFSLFFISIIDFLSKERQASSFGKYWIVSQTVCGETSLCIRRILRNFLKEWRDTYFLKACGCLHKGLPWWLRQ